MPKITLLIVLLSVLLVGFGWYFLTGKGILSRVGMAGRSQEPLRIARYYWPGQYWVDIADEKGWFTEAGLVVETVDTNADFYASLQDVVDGELDTQNFWLYDLIRFESQGADLQMVLNSDSSSGAEGIVARNTISTVAELKGKRVGVEADAATEYLLFTVLKQNNLSFTDVEIVDTVTSEKLPELLVSGEVDAIVVWEPHLSQALEAPGAVKIWDSSEIPGIISAGYTFRTDFVEERPEEVRAFVEVWQRATQFIKDNPAESYEIIARRYQDTPENVEAYTRVNRIQDLEENRRAFSVATGFSSLYGQSKYIQQYLINTGTLTEEVDATLFLNPRFINELSQ